MGGRIIIGIAGKARSGKDTTAEYLQKYHGFTRDSFGAPVRRALMDIIGIKTYEEYERLKELESPILGNKTPRDFMQKFGTNFAREQYSDSIWIDSFFARNVNADRLLASDVRFDNEALAIKNNGGIIIQVSRPGVEGIKSNHSSEAGINQELVDYYITNDDSIDNLYAVIETTIHSIFRKVYQ